MQSTHEWAFCDSGFSYESFNSKRYGFCRYHQVNREHLFHRMLRVVRGSLFMERRRQGCRRRAYRDVFTAFPETTHHHSPPEPNISFSIFLKVHQAKRRHNRRLFAFYYQLNPPISIPIIRAQESPLHLDHRRRRSRSTRGLCPSLPTTWQRCE